MTVARSHISDNVMQWNRLSQQNPRLDQVKQSRVKGGRSHTLSHFYFHFHSWLDYLALSMYMSMIYEKSQKNNWKEAVRPSGLLTMDKKGRAIPKTYKVCENDHKDPPTNTEAPLKSSVGNYLHASVLSNLGIPQPLTCHLPKFHVPLNRYLESHRNLKNKNKRNITMI